MPALSLFHQRSEIQCSLFPPLYSQTPVILLWPIFQQSLCSAGLFLAPQMVGEALKGGRLVAQVMSQSGYACTPPQGLPQTHSFITAIELGSAAKMVAFCEAVQKCCPIGSYIQPIPGQHSMAQHVTA